MQFRYIDFHVHAFADKIAARTVAALQETAQQIPETNGTLASTEETMHRWGVDGYVILTIATKPSQHLVCNNWAASCRCDHIFPFGSVHPDGEDVMEELERIKALGLYGIKLHPDYQDFYADEERMFPIYRRCGELGLPIIFHAGVDPVCPETVHCSPRMAAKALEAAPDTTMIMAHMGGNALWDEVYDVLAGNYGNLWLDTALAGSHMDDATVARLIEKQGADRILLASDCPWDNTAVTIEKLRRIGLTQEQQEQIFHRNAEQLLGLDHAS